MSRLKILVIKLKFIGDVLLGLPVLRALREAYPKAQIDYLVPENAWSIVESVSFADHVFGLKKVKGIRGIKQTLKTAYQLRKNNYDIVFDLVGHDRSALIAWLVGAKKRIGRWAPRGFFGRKYCYTDCVRVSQARMHATLKDLELLQVIGVKDNNLEPVHLKIESTWINEMKQWVKQDTILCYLTTSSYAKEWPLDNWVTFYKQYRDLQDKLLFTTGFTAREQAILQAFKKALPQARVLPFIPTLRQMMGLIASSQVVICGDTSVAHMASCCGVPSIVLFGPSDSTEWHPLGKHTIIQAPACQCKDFYFCERSRTCLSDVMPEAVYDALFCN